MTKQLPISQSDINRAGRGHQPPPHVPSTPQKALAAEGMTLNRDGSVTAYDGTNSDHRKTQK